MNDTVFNLKSIQGLFIRTFQNRKYNEYLYLDNWIYKGMLKTVANIYEG